MVVLIDESDSPLNYIYLVLFSVILGKVGTNKLGEVSLLNSTTFKKAPLCLTKQLYCHVYLTDHAMIQFFLNL